MGLFSNNKKPCPICGSPTPRLLPRKFDGQPICKTCEDKIDLPGDVLERMTLEAFRKYLVDYEENKSLRDLYHETYGHGAFFFSNEMLGLDEDNGLIRLKSSKNSWVIEKKYLKSFCILEDDRTIFENGKGELICHTSDIPARVRALEPVIAAFRIEKREYDRREEMEKIRRLHETDEQRRERERISETYRPRFEDPRLFDRFYIKVTLDHPYWTSYDDFIGAPAFDDSYPSAEDYLKEYQKKIDDLHILADKLMKMMDIVRG